MESLLYQAGVIGRQSIAFSAGGRNDLITGFSRGTGSTTGCGGATERELINTGSLAANIERRLEIYGNSDYAAYISVGAAWPV